MADTEDAAALSLGPPGPSEYAAYYGRYVSLVGGNNVLSSLAAQATATRSVLRAIPASRSDYRYAPGKWSIKEVIAHIIDTERVFSYRALSFARSDSAPLPGFEQDDWMNAAAFGEIPYGELVDEYEHVRESTILLFRHVSQEALMRKGIAGGNPFTVRAIAYIIAGHELHHMKVIGEKYVSG